MGNKGSAWENDRKATCAHRKTKELNYKPSAVVPLRDCRLQVVTLRREALNLHTHHATKFFAQHAFQHDGEEHGESKTKPPLQDRGLMPQMHMRRVQIVEDYCNHGTRASLSRQVATTT